MFIACGILTVLIVGLLARELYLLGEPESSYPLRLVLKSDREPLPIPGPIIFDTDDTAEITDPDRTLEIPR